MGDRVKGDRARDDKAKNDRAKSGSAKGDNPDGERPVVGGGSNPGAPRSASPGAPRSASPGAPRSASPGATRSASSVATEQSDAKVRSTRCIALVGPYLSGKTTLFEALLARTGAIGRAGTIAEASTVGDSSAEARSHAMSVEMNIADTTYLGDAFALLDLPGSIEFQTESLAALPVVDMAVVVCEPDPRRVPALQIILKSLAEQNIPHALFLNKIDSFDQPVREIIPMLQPASPRPLVLRQVPIWQHGKATGFIDLALERAFNYRTNAASEEIARPDAMKTRESDARYQMLEQIADFDDALMEQLLNDLPPQRQQVFDDLARELREGLICPVLLGSALNGNGIVRLLKVLRHETPFVEATRKRLGIDGSGTVAQVVKTLHTAHGGKISVARVLLGMIGEGTVVKGPGAEQRVSGVVSILGEQVRKRGPAHAGDVVGLGRLEGISTGATITTGKQAVKQLAPISTPEPVYGQAIELANRADDVKLSAALIKLLEEDPALHVQHGSDAGQQIVIWGQGEMHLRVALERLKRKYAIDAQAKPRQVAYKETIRTGTEIRGRHKKQSGGHGQFGDVVLDIKPLPRGGGIQFGDKIHGGTVPKQYIPSVEIGVKDYLAAGPLGFPVVDVAVTLLDGSYHSVDSSDMAFRLAGRLAMSEGLPHCQPVLLEPIMAVSVAAPSEATARVNAIIAQRRGQILGFDAREGWPGWDMVEAHIPENEMSDLIVELRSATAGVGTFSCKFDHLSELNGKQADQVLAGKPRRSA